MTLTGIRQRVRHSACPEHDATRPIVIRRIAARYARAKDSFADRSYLVPQASHAKLNPTVWLQTRAHPAFADPSTSRAGLPRTSACGTSFVTVGRPR